MKCHVCNSLSIASIPGGETLKRVTSDCRPWSQGVRLAVCRSCGTIQAAVDRRWQEDVDLVYASYAVYHQGQGAEQAVFDQASGQSAFRSARILERLLSLRPLPPTGRLLDVGCGNGALLRTFSRMAPRWGLAGTELDGRCRDRVEAIANVEKLYTCALSDVPGTFDLVTLVHALEHIVHPQEFLADLRYKLAPGGWLVVEVPDFRSNPFDLLVADHCTHFTEATLTALLLAAGYELVHVTADWVPKELTVVAKAARQAQPPAPAEARADAALVEDRLTWLNHVVSHAGRLARQGPLGILGTSIAATWLFQELNAEVAFFVDEDPHRRGRPFLGRPVLDPRDAPEGAVGFIPLPPGLARAVARRLRRPGVAWHCPAEFSLSRGAGSVCAGIAGEGSGSRKTERWSL